jgi:predicted nuclease of predicted toxin-antitoxin system
LEGTTDNDIIKKCFEGNQIILTQDNDFGELISTTNIFILFYYLS